MSILTTPDPSIGKSGIGGRADRPDTPHGRQLRAPLQGPIFEAMSLGQQEVIRAASRRLPFRRRSRIYRAGAPSERFFVVASGVVKLAVVSAEGRELILNFLYPGDAFGELAVIDTRPHDHMAEAYEDCVVHAIERDVVRRVVQESPAVARAIQTLLADRLRTYRTRVEELLFRSALARVAHTLADLAHRHGIRDAAGTVLPLRLSQRDLGNMVGITRETVNFVLKDLRRRDLIEITGRSIRVREPDALLNLR